MGKYETQPVLEKSYYQRISLIHNNGCQETRIEATLKCDVNVRHLYRACNPTLTSIPDLQQLSHIVVAASSCKDSVLDGCIIKKLHLLLKYTPIGLVLSTVTS